MAKTDEEGVDRFIVAWAAAFCFIALIFGWNALR
jgi:hypothetical protein